MSALQLYDLNGEQRFTGTSVGGVQTVAARLSSANILALGTTPVTIVPAVSGKIIVPLIFMCRMHYGGATYNEAGKPRVFLSATDFASSGWGADLAGNSIFAATLNTATYYTVTENFPSLLNDVSETLDSLTSVPLRIDENLAVTVGNGSVDITTLYTLFDPT
jgi:hypothetical protein